MTRWEEIQTAIEQRDAITLRKMAEEARKEGTRMFLTLLAGMVDQQAKKGAVEGDCLAGGQQDNRIRVQARERRPAVTGERWQKKP